MKRIISRLLEVYENGKMSRRDLVRGLTLLAAGFATASAGGFQGHSVVIFRSMSTTWSDRLSSTSAPRPRLHGKVVDILGRTLGPENPTTRISTDSLRESTPRSNPSD